MNDSKNVVLVDDEPALLKALTRLLKAEGFSVKTFQSASAFLAAPRPLAPACVVLDEAMPGMTGMELQQRLLEENSTLAVVFITGNGDIPMSVRAIKSGAVDFLTKPVKDNELLASIRTALKKSAEQVAAQEELRSLQDRLALLSGREGEVFQHVVRGIPNKQIAMLLGVVEQTVKIHRSRVMTKMGADSLAHLVLIAERLGLASSNETPL
jgi:FixJ family two-component response regulator